MTLAETEGGANQAEGGAGAGDHQDYQLISDEGSHRNTRLLFLATRVLTTAGFIKTSKQRKLSLPGFTRLAALSQYVQGSLWTNTALVTETDIPLLGRRNHLTSLLHCSWSRAPQVKCCWCRGVSLHVYITSPGHNYWTDVPALSL